ncbi:hypothetical protein BGW38_004467 [Lunasporangiospora selenospora]|uniref:Nucleoporin Nup133/Nup155-like C-terminal domain-containing protein n=1 Tax=Lunasporangiospora selenospora TaxID=979761 RepID=A0A9P6KHN3_9FUNG|nr:hypothetical protein BGW38_004467 [Lunasporangiospora selenospora]
MPKTSTTVAQETTSVATIEKDTSSNASTNESSGAITGQLFDRGQFFTPSVTGSDTEDSWTPTRHFSTDEAESSYASEIGSSDTTLDEDAIYYKNDRTMVAYFGPLPREVEEALAKTDFYTQPMSAKVDLDAGFGMVVSQRTCYIWAVQKSTMHRTPPVCYTLPMPPSTTTSAENAVRLPVVIFTKSDDQHSGVLACSADGTCWYWEDIDLCFSNVDQHVDTKISVTSGDYISHVECSGPLGYFFGTRHANIYQVIIKKQFGSSSLTATQLQVKTNGAIASIINMMGFAQNLDTTQKLSAMTSGPKSQDPQGRWDLFAMTRRSLFKWQVYRSGECNLESEAPILEKVTEQILRDYTATLPMGSDPRVRLLDICFIKNGKLLVLATFFDTAVKTASTPLSCALITISTQYGVPCDIEHIKYIQHTIEEDLRPEAHPKLVVPHGGSGAFIVTSRSAIICSTLPNIDFEELIPLKTDRIIGYGCEDWKQRGQELNGASELSIVCRSSGRLGIHIQLDGLLLSQPSKLPDKEQGTAQLQAKLEQAVFFSGKKHNPISFDLTYYDSGDLNVASLNISKLILNSHASLLSTSKDMTARLSERYRRIRNIIGCIQAANMTNLLSVDTRFQLCWSAEKLAAANAFWVQYQAWKGKSEPSLENSKQIIQDAATISLQKLGAHAVDDPVAFFMKYHVDALEDLFSNLQIAPGKLKSLPQKQQTELIKDINRIVVLSLRSAWSYRRQNIRNYSLQGSSRTEPWTGSESVIRALSAQYQHTREACGSQHKTDESTMEVDGDEDGHSDLTNQLCDLADITLQAYSEHLQYLEGLPPSSENNIRISTAVTAYDDAKSQFLSPLIELKKIQIAITLSQRYKDFATLVRLCNGDEKSITLYMNKYQQEFANALFQWYMDNDQVSKLLEQGEEYSDLFTVFLDNHDYNGIAWLHDIKIKRFVEASDRVQEVALRDMNMDRRRTMFSLSKLLFVAGGLPHEELDESTTKYANKINLELEMATIQALVANEWESRVGSLASLREKAKMVVGQFNSPTLAKQATMREALLKSVKSLLNRQTIYSEELLDVLMLQGTREIDNLDICDSALGICVNAADIPESRRLYVLQDIWRRIFIADADAFWQCEDVGDSEARDRLQATWMYRAFTIIYRAGGHKDEWMLRPEDAKGSMPESLFRQRFSARAGETTEADEDERSSRSPVEEIDYRAIKKDIDLENEELERRINLGQLVRKWGLIKMLVKEEDVKAQREGSVSLLASQDRDVEMTDA